MGNSTAKSGSALKDKMGREAGFIEQMFREMAARSPEDENISKDTFLTFFDLPGVLGDRLFDVFDTKKTGVIDFEEFIDGYYRFSRGSAEDKINVLFLLFDLDDKGGITEKELTTVLLSMITPPNQVMNAADRLKSPGLGSKSGISLRSASERSELLGAEESDLGGGGKLARDSFLNSTPGSPIETPMDDDGESAIESVQKKVAEMVKDAFAKCDVDKSGRLDFGEFRKWLNQNKELLATMDDLFVMIAWDNIPKETTRPQYSMFNAEHDTGRQSIHGTGRHAFTLQLANDTILQCDECHLKYVSKREDIPSDVGKDKKPGDEKEDEWDWIIASYAFDMSKNESGIQFCLKCGQSLASVKSRSTLRLNPEHAGSSANLAEEHFEGIVKMPGGRWGRLRNRFALLHGKFLYLYKTKDKEFPIQVVFVQGCFVEAVKDKRHGMTEVKVVPPRGSGSKGISIFLERKSDAVAWVNHLERAAETIDIRKYYEMKERLGKGSFASVYVAIDRETGQEVAVKAIEKKAIDGKQKEYIRIEMSVMKLVKHPHVISLNNVFETPSHIYMVMPLYRGGDLYDYMKNNARHGIPEEQSRMVIWNTLHALKYLHGIGIVHRDLKPENLLLKHEGNPTDVVITDFGLSKFAAPHEAMKAACGTLSYVAPEVLRMEGYSKEVDLWSIGVICFLTLRAKLPFHDSSKNKIIARILRQRVQMNDPQWQKVSGVAKDLIRKLLLKDPSERITVDDAIDHPWFEEIRLRRERSARASGSSKNLSPGQKGKGGSSSSSSSKLGGEPSAPPMADVVALRMMRQASLATLGLNEDGTEKVKGPSPGPPS